MAVTILLVEDHELVRYAMTRALEDYGFRVVAVHDGVAAWELLQVDGRRVDVVVTDVQMPRMDGLELAERVSTLANSPPLLFISGYPRGRIPIDQPFLSKPFRAEQLADAIAETLKRATVPSVSPGAPMNDPEAA